MPGCSWLKYVSILPSMRLWPGVVELGSVMSALRTVCPVSVSSGSTWCAVVSLVAVFESRLTAELPRQGTASVTCTMDVLWQTELPRQGMASVTCTMDVLWQTDWWRSWKRWRRRRETTGTWWNTRGGCWERSSTCHRLTEVDTASVTSALTNIDRLYIGTGVVRWAQ